MSDLMLDQFFANFPYMLPQLIEGVGDTLALASAAIVVGLVVGFLLCLARISRFTWLSWFARIYIEIMRGTPALVQLFLIYFGLVGIGIRFGAFEAAVIGLGLNMAAYVAEILRGALAAIDSGQKEAAQAIGMPPAMSMRLIIIPQAMPIALPPLGNAAISLLKDTSIAALISAPDLLLQGRNMASEYFTPLPIFVTIGIIYFALCFPLSLAIRSLERRWRV